MITYNQYGQLRVRQRALAVTCLSWRDFLGETGSPAPCRCRTSCLLMSLHTPGTKYHLLPAAVLLLFLLLCFFFSFQPVIHRFSPIARTMGNRERALITDILRQCCKFFRLSIMTLDILQKRKVLITSLVCCACHFFSDIFYLHFLKLKRNVQF